MVDKKCPAHVCKSLMQYQIIADKCKGCTKCARQCPVSAINGKVKEAHTIDLEKCIRCGSCTNTCPFGLAPAQILFAFDKKDAARLEELNVGACMECGCCSFVCPANRPLVQTNKLSKAFLKESKEKERK